MGTLSAILLAILGVFGAAFAKILADEFKAWSPSIVSAIIALAAKVLPAAERDRYAEEWTYYVEAVPGDIGKIITALRLGFAALKISSLVPSAGKRALDVFLALIAIAFVVPLALVTSLLIRLDSPGPILTQSTSVGRNGKRFRVYRFRTRISESAGAHVTNVGRIMRQVHIDEIPQLLNILRGDMSWTGPRALPTGEADSDVRSPEKPGFGTSYLEVFKQILRVLFSKGPLY